MVVNYEDFEYSLSERELVTALANAKWQDNKGEFKKEYRKEMDFDTIRFMVKELCMYEDEELLDIYKDDFKDYVLRNFVSGV